MFLPNTAHTNVPTNSVLLGTLFLLVFPVIELGFRSFSPIASQSIPPASSNLFLSEDDLPPSNQLEVPQIVIPDTMLPGSSSAMQLSEVMLPLSTMQVNTTYSLLRTLL